MKPWLSTGGPVVRFEAMRPWELQSAKARLSELLRAAEDAGPQEITLQGNGVAVVLAKSDYDRLTGKPGSFVNFMRRSPLLGIAAKLQRDKRPARKVRL
jgi:prevent-host-death family protein